MAESPDLASVYHLKLKDAYEDPDALKESEEQLVQLLGEVELQLNETYYLVGDEFSMVDVMLIPLLALIELLGLEVDYIVNRPKIAEYWLLVKQRPSYKALIGNLFGLWNIHLLHSPPTAILTTGGLWHGLAHEEVESELSNRISSSTIH
ncbi:hypothetical protein IFM89_023843 [Coptis chinensis]|uniref:GST C-terminal domain-containing protein n=1 Tax=Coptis chinensis TaxID=261450 RepID=A0A835J086_9MAGN|nr:hypothetical protein IFM89_023843 [Coptis chinensis]